MCIISLNVSIQIFTVAPMCHLFSHFELIHESF